MTETENRVWLKLRRKQLKGYPFYRQKIIGKYIVDFYCPKANLVIELDGGQHYSGAGKAKDMTRDKFLAEMGIKVLRISDKDVFEQYWRSDGGDMELLMIYKISPHPSLLKRGEIKGRNDPLDYAKRSFFNCSGLEENLSEGGREKIRK